jgi:hypothetical protein
MCLALILLLILQTLIFNVTYFYIGNEKMEKEGDGDGHGDGRRPLVLTIY